MAYQNNIPQPTDQLSKSQSDILNNFAAIKTLVDINHVTFDVADQGKHKFVTMPVQGSSPATLGGELALFSRTSAFTTVPEMAFRRQTNGSVIEFTSLGAVAGTATVPGWSMLPSGILIKWGSGTTSNPGGVLTVVLNAAGQPTYSAVYAAFSNSKSLLPDLTGFTAFTGTASATFQSETGGVSMFFVVIGLAS